MSSALRRAAVRVLAARACTTEAASDGLAPVIAELSPDDRRRLALLARDMHGYLQPADAIERGWVDRVTAALWRRNLLDRLEIRLLHAYAEGRQVAGLPSLEALARARNRIDKDEVVFRRNLAELHRNAARITPHTDSARLAWLAERAAAREALVRRVCAAAGDPQEAPSQPSLHRSRGPAGSPPRPEGTSARSRPDPTAARRPDPATPPRPGATQPAPARPAPTPGGAPPRPEPSATVPSPGTATKPATPGEAPATAVAAERAASPLRPASGPDRPAGGPVGAPPLGAAAAAAPGGAATVRPAPTVGRASAAERPAADRIAAHTSPEPLRALGAGRPGPTVPASSSPTTAPATPTAAAGPTAAAPAPLPLVRTG